MVTTSMVVLGISESVEDHDKNGIEEIPERAKKRRFLSCIRI
jgi:hypothetical protein